MHMLIYQHLQIVSGDQGKMMMDLKRVQNQVQLDMEREQTVLGLFRNLLVIAGRPIYGQMRIVQGI